MGKALGAALTVILAITLVAGCDGGDGGDDVGAGPGKASPSQVGTFRVCQPGPGGGGYRVRAIGVSCEEVRRILPRLLSSATGRHPATLVTKRERERVYRNDFGWTCLSQGQPRRFGFTLILCVRGSQAILYRFS
jgi:hypothetical protein